jgi:hypothetical protein
LRRANSALPASKKKLACKEIEATGKKTKHVFLSSFSLGEARRASSAEPNAPTV